ncbi:hypothetical protein Acy02nite_77100 [Actinoplanes cyaneus]|uniref:Uncharacterized protein n=1 Tax=Actinoplanes cyaneus TaxID=52696 RepID=A0A919MBP6_9ACTN|nr:hypothetical protein [Actinoplanes cyaneus]MCW2139675.1 hypothetical protein [Actinoplanes cyaneus]GID69829.1 hypothetical protein Acy02nite_77100 [Actinoplanes cyaneus]
MLLNGKVFPTQAGTVDEIVAVMHRWAADDGAEGPQVLTNRAFAVLTPGPPPLITGRRFPYIARRPPTGARRTARCATEKHVAAARACRLVLTVVMRHEERP